ncbi:MAG: MFS transporter [Syntrophotaleaceae bacterium]
MNNTSSQQSVHYGWIIVGVSMLAVFGCIGLGRLALGMLLPSMGEDLGLSYSQMGIISAGNFTGYLGAVFFCGWRVRRLGARTMIACGLLTVATSMMLISRTSHYPTVLGLYILTGVGTGAANMPVMGLVAHWFKARSRGRAGGLLMAGNGFAIMLSGTLIPLLTASQGAAGWRSGWLLLGALVGAIALLCALLLRNSPEEMKLDPIGREATSEAAPNEPLGSSPPSKAPPYLLLLVAGVFFIFCFTYVIYATFIVTTLVQEMSFSETQASHLWVWIGFCALFSGPLFGALSDRIGRSWGMMSVFAVQTCAYLLAASHLSGIWIYLSVTLYGLSAFSIPSIIVATLSDYLPRERVTAALGHVTFFASFGQIAGPSLAGLLADLSGGFSSSYLLAAGMTATAATLVMLLPKTGKTTTLQPIAGN